MLKAQTGEERREAIFRERARRLARPPAPQRPPASEPLLVFRVGSERFAIALGAVREVMGRAAFAPVPGSPETLAGVFNLRGEITPVWDLARLLGLPGAQQTGRAVILVRKGAGTAGLGVDSVEEIRPVQPAELAQPEPRPPRVKGITADLVTVLDPQRLWEEESR